MARQTSVLNKLPLIARIGVGAGLLLLVGVAYFVVFYGDIESSIKAAQGQEQQLRTDLADARKNEFAYQKDLAELTDRQHRQRELNKVLPVDTEYPSFLSAVQSVANVSGIGLTSWTPQPRGQRAILCSGANEGDAHRSLPPGRQVLLWCGPARIASSIWKTFRSPIRKFKVTTWW